jgi:hypothetical protein
MLLIGFGAIRIGKISKTRNAMVHSPAIAGKFVVCRIGHVATVTEKVRRREPADRTSRNHFAGPTKPFCQGREGVLKQTRPNTGKPENGGFDHADFHPQPNLP